MKKLFEKSYRQTINKPGVCWTVVGSIYIMMAVINFWILIIALSCFILAVFFSVLSELYNNTLLYFLRVLFLVTSLIVPAGVAAAGLFLLNLTINTISLMCTAFFNWVNAVSPEKIKEIKENIEKIKDCSEEFASLKGNFLRLYDTFDIKEDNCSIICPITQDPLDNKCVFIVDIINGTNNFFPYFFKDEETYNLIKDAKNPVTNKSWSPDCSFHYYEKNTVIPELSNIARSILNSAEYIKFLAAPRSIFQPSEDQNDQMRQNQEQQHCHSI
jgi:hypothetical protein